MLLGLKERANTVCKDSRISSEWPAAAQHDGSSVLKLGASPRDNRRVVAGVGADDWLDKIVHGPSTARSFLIG